MSQKHALQCLVFAILFGLSTGVLAQDEASDILARINNLRASVGVAAYNFNGSLAGAAQQQAQWIIETGDVSHTHPDGTGPRTRALGNGYPSSDVSENIYGGTMANADIAWNFWLNSPIHYNGLVDQRYRDVGVGIAHGAWGAAYVIVFGNPGGPPPAPPSSGGGGSGNSGGGDGGEAVAALPSYIVGQDEHGNIMHEVQPGDTLGDIALIYGYTWDDLPYLMQLNGLADVRDLEPGSIFLIPPQDGTWTPAPGSEPAITPTDAAEASATPLPTIEPPVTLIPIATAPHVATSVEAPAELIATVVEARTDEAPADIAALPTNASGSPVPPGQVMVIQSGPSPWLGIAFGAQAILLGAAFVEFFPALTQAKIIAMIFRYKPQFYEAFKKALARREPFPLLRGWARKTRALVWAVYRVADAQGLDTAARKRLLLHVDKRNMSVETMLGTIMHHAEKEYPYLLGEHGRFNQMVIHASNMNDRYFMLQLLKEEALQAEPLKAALEALRAHLDAIPTEA